MKVLTDTHALVWALSDPAALGARARTALAESPFTASVANLWELVLKARKPGALTADPLTWWEKFVIGPRIPTLSIRTAHIRRLTRLPVEGLTLVTKDVLLARYGQPVIWE